MGHWLDAEFTGSGITIETEGVPLTKRETLAFDGTFEVVDDGSGKKTVFRVRDTGGNTVVFVVASTEQNRTLPAPSLGKTILYVVSGASLLTIHRNAGEKINGVVGNYLVPFANALAIATSDGTDWQIRSFADVEGGGGGGGEAPMTFSPVDIFRLTPITAIVPQNAPGAQSTGTQFFIRPGGAIAITGIRFYWAGTANETVRCSLWALTTSTMTPVATVDVVTSGPGVYVGTFATPYEVPANRYQSRFVVSNWDTAANHYTYISGSTTEAATFTPARPFFAGSRLGWVYFDRFHNAGEGLPDTAGGTTEWYMIEPVLEEA